MLLRQFKAERSNEQFPQLYNDKVVIEVLPEYVVAAYRQGHTDEIFYQLDFDKIKAYCKNQEQVAKIYFQQLQEYQQEAIKQIKKDAILIKQFGIHISEADYYKNMEQIKSLVNNLQNSPFKSIYKQLIVERNNIQMDLAKKDKYDDKIKQGQLRKEETQKRKDQIALRLKNAKVRQISRPTIEDDYIKQQQLLKQLNEQQEKAQKLSESFQQQQLERYQQKNDEYQNKCYQIQQFMDSQNYEKELKTMRYFEMYNSPNKHNLTITYPRQFQHLTKSIQIDQFFNKQAERMQRVQENIEEIEMNTFNYQQLILQKLYDKEQKIESQKVIKLPDSKLSKRIEEAKNKREKLYNSNLEDKIRRMEERDAVTIRMLKSIKESQIDQIQQRKKVFDEKSLRHSETINISRLQDQQKTLNLINSLNEEPQQDKKSEQVLAKIEKLQAKLRQKHTTEKMDFKQTKQIKKLFRELEQLQQ